ncbi:unnamed protein product [Pleuronectes platessa]|uniref:Sema domain-containing protein n=1 Tax=Pleuronectes platessa TaxID=8262 RepID=A0A9N7TIA6_PLEPL|nr:unnamed protein product [Pleuronectes platessa]
MLTSGWGVWALSPCGLVLLICSSVCLSQQPHLKLADCSRKEHPVVSYQMLTPWMSEFSHPGVKDFSQLALDLSRNQLIVGARNFIFKLSLSNASLIQATEWAPSDDTKRSCQSKGKSAEECQNYLRVLLISGRTLFTCGTNAFAPVCMSRQIDNISEVLDTVNGVARCPYDPRHNSTAMVTEKGELYCRYSDRLLGT